MNTVERSALVGHGAAAMYALVEDIESYPRFLPWCSGTEVHQRDERVTVATIRVDFRGVHQQFTTSNDRIAGESIAMKFVRGPFKQLDGLWRFVPLGDEACRIEFRLSYQLANPLLERLVGPVFNQIASTFVDAFVKRAEALHGDGAGA